MYYIREKRKCIDLNSTQWDRIEKIKEYQDFLDKKIKESKEKGKTEVLLVNNLIHYGSRICQWRKTGQQ